MGGVDFTGIYMLCSFKLLIMKKHSSPIPCNPFIYLNTSRFKDTNKTMTNAIHGNV